MPETWHVACLSARTVRQLPHVGSRRRRKHMWARKVCWSCVRLAGLSIHWWTFLFMMIRRAQLGPVAPPRCVTLEQDHCHNLFQDHGYRIRYAVTRCAWQHCASDRLAFRTCRVACHTMPLKRSFATARLGQQNTCHQGYALHYKCTRMRLCAVTRLLSTNYQLLKRSLSACRSLPCLTDSVQMTTQAADALHQPSTSMHMAKRANSHGEHPPKVFKSALCILLPYHLMQPVQKIRCFKDKSYVRWPPHINLLYPFWEDKGRLAHALHGRHGTNRGKHECVHHSTRVFTSYCMEPPCLFCNVYSAALQSANIVQSSQFRYCCDIILRCFVSAVLHTLMSVHTILLLVCCWDTGDCFEAMAAQATQALAHIPPFTVSLHSKHLLKALTC